MQAPVNTLRAIYGAWRPYKLIGAASANATTLQASPGFIGAIWCTNIDTVPVFLKFYDMTAAPASTDTPVLVFGIPGNVAGGGGSIGIPPDGVRFLVGIGFRIVKGIGDADNTSIAASTVALSLLYL
jgi:hypothetical protein